MAKNEIKQGRHGKLYVYHVVYTQGGDKGFGRRTWRTWAYNADHATDIFESGDEGFDLISVKRA